MKTITVFLLTLLLVLPSAVVFADDVQYNGNIRVSGAIAENSDGRLNRNIVPLSDTLSDLKIQMKRKQRRERKKKKNC